MSDKYHKNNYYHLYNRGVHKNKIFFERNDYLFFLRKLKLYKSKYFISIICYCLMPNHFHLFVKQNTTKYTIGKFIGDTTNSYTKTINKKYNLSGVLFQGPTKNKHIDKQEYFIWLCKYILLNPVHSNLVQKAENWEFSCIKDFYGLRKGTLINKKEIIKNFSSTNDFKKFIEEPVDKYDLLIQM
jgi:putative transposase